MLVIKINIITFFPNIYNHYLNTSFIGQLCKENKVSFSIFGLLDHKIYDNNKRINIDDKVFGGGYGMLMRFDFLYFFIKKFNIDTSLMIHPSPKGVLLNYKFIPFLSKDVYNNKSITIICSRYEGIDRRIIDEWNVKEISIGDYVLYDGDTACFVIINALIRNMLSNPRATEEESFSNNGLLEYDQYTHPKTFLSRDVPNELFSGNHKNISNWRKLNSIKNTINKKNEDNKYK